MLKEFKPRLTLPEKGNKYYISKSSGGYNTAIKGNNSNGQRSKDFDVLPNCVSWAIGRFMELSENTKFSTLKPVNAEDFIKYADKSLKIGNIPQLGAIMVWEGLGSHPGHVAVVEKISTNNEIVTSESGWSSSRLMWTQIRRKGTDSNWGQNSSYKFLGFIYNPAECCQPKSNSNSTSTNTSTNKPSNNSISNNTSNTTSKPIQTQVKAKQVAKSKDTKLSGTYTVTAKIGLNLRDGAGTGSESLVLIPYGTKVKNYGYYTMLNGSKWMYVQVTIDGITYTGFCLSSYLKNKI